MKIILNRISFLEQLSKAVRVVPSQEIVQVLGCIYLKAETDVITVIGGDGTTYVIAKMGSEHVVIQEQGTFVVQARLLYEIVRKIDEKEVVLFCDAERELLTITTISSNSKFVLKLLDVEEYPLPEPIMDYTSFSIRGERLKDSIRQTLFAVHKKEQTPALTGVKMEVRNNRLLLMGCDRHRLGRVEQIIDSRESTQNGEVIVPSRTMNELEKLMDNELIEIKVSKSKIEFAGENYSLISNSISGTYPDVDRNAHSDYLTHFVVSAPSLISSLDRVSIIASQDKTNLISMRVSAENVELYSSSEVNHASEYLSLLSFQGTEYKVSFNVGYALEALKAMDVNEVHVKVNKGMQMIIFTSDEKSGSLQLLMAARTAR